jgi:hypothetical protein
MRVMQMRGRAKEPFLADLPLERARRHVGMRLPAGGALNVSVRNVSLHMCSLLLPANLVSAETKCKFPSQGTLVLKTQVVQLAETNQNATCMKTCSPVAGDR